MAPNAEDCRDGVICVVYGYGCYCVFLGSGRSWLESAWEFVNCSAELYELSVARLKADADWLASRKKVLDWSYMAVIKDEDGFGGLSMFHSYNERMRRNLRAIGLQRLEFA